MTKAAHNPFFEPDFSKFADLGKSFGDFKVPGVDMDALASAQRRNVEAVAAANQLAYEGLQAVLRREADILRQTMQESSRIVSQMISTGSPEEKVAKHAELSKVAFEKALTNMKELAEMVAKSNYEAVEVISNRVSESLEELRGLVQTPAAGGKSKK